MAVIGEKFWARNQRRYKRISLYPMLIYPKLTVHQSHSAANATEALNVEDYRDSVIRPRAETLANIQKVDQYPKFINTNWRRLVRTHQVPRHSYQSCPEYRQCRGHSNPPRGIAAAAAGGGQFRNLHRQSKRGREKEKVRNHVCPLYQPAENPTLLKW